MEPHSAYAGRELRAAVIGLGVGEQHVLGYQRAPGCRVVAVADRDESRLHEVGERRDVAERHTDWRGVIERDDVDVVSICTYDEGHVEQAVAALKAGKHVMVEKPVAVERGAAERLIDVWRASGRLLTSNLILRASPRFRRLREDVRKGEFGDLFYLEGDYIHEILHKITEGWRGRVPGYSVVYGGGVHLIDLLRWIVGREVEEVCGMGGDLLVRGSGYAAEDTTVNLLRFEGGALAKTTTSFGPQRTKFHALQVYGTRGTFVNDMPHAKRFHGTRPEDEKADETPYPAIEKGDLLMDFVQAVRTGTEPEVTAVDVFRVMDVCFAAVDSIRTGRTVKVDYLV